MATSYRQPTANASNGKGSTAPHSTLISGDIRPNHAVGGRKLLDQFRDKMRSLHYALATEKAYRHWSPKFLRFHRDGDDWKHPATLGKPEIEAFLTHLATKRRVSAKTQNQAFSAILFLYKHVLELELPKIDALRAKQSSRLPVVLSPQEVARLIKQPGGAVVPSSASRKHAPAGNQAGGHAGWPDKASNLPHTPAQLRHAPARIWCRHPNRARTTRTQGRFDHDDLHPHTSAWCMRGAEPTRRSESGRLVTGNDAGLPTDSSWGPACRGRFLRL